MVGKWFSQKNGNEEHRLYKGDICLTHQQNKVQTHIQRRQTGQNFKISVKTLL